MVHYKCLLKNPPVGNMQPRKHIGSEGKHEDKIQTNYKNHSNHDSLHTDADDRLAVLCQRQH